MALDIDESRRPKFAAIQDGVPTPFRYGACYDLSAIGGRDRLVISGDGGTQLLLDLARRLEAPFGLLYVLVVPRSQRKPGRYQSPEAVGREDLESFLRGYAEFLDGDGRHNLWIHSTTDGSTIVYDRHNLIYAYGPIVQWVEDLRVRGYARANVEVPTPHEHHYLKAFDAYEAALLTEFDWQYSPLTESQDV